MVKKRTNNKKTTRRGRFRTRVRSIRQSPRTQLAGRSAKNIIIGSGLINATSQIVGPQTSRAGIYAQPLNLIITGAGSSFLGISGQKDLVSAGLKIGGSRLISTQIMPRLQALSTRGGPGGAGRMNRGGYT
jgi:hypothetical protein